MRLVLLALSAILTVDQAIPQQRDRPVPRAATGIVRGRVVSASTGAPLHRVQITLTGAVQAIAPVVTNTRGEYEVTNVAAGSYTVTARRLGYLTMQYGQRRVAERGLPVVVADNEVVPKIDFALVRGGVLAGLITDDVGTEYAGVRVDALEFKYVRGRRTPVTAATTTTNDLGQYRLAGLLPGSYLIRASTMDTWSNNEGTASFTFVPTYYPGVNAVSDGEMITVAPSQEQASLNFALRPGRAARIFGRYEASGNATISGQAISLSVTGRTIGNAVQSNAGAGSTRTDQNGTFEFRNLAPGEYTVSTGGDKDRGNVTVILSAGDEREVVIGPRQQTLVTGNVRVDADQPPRFPLTRLRVATIAADPDYLPPFTFAPTTASVGADGTFRYPDLVGSYLFRIDGLPEDWIVSRVALNENDFTDVPLDLGPGRPPVAPVQLTITNRVATLTGKVVDADDRAAPDATIVVFAADASRWTAASRYIKITRPRADGQFTISGLIPGRYLAAARRSIEDGQWEDPLFLKSLVDSAASFEARLEEPATLDLRIARQR